MRDSRGAPSVLDTSRAVSATSGIGWSAVLLLILCVLVFLQSTPVLGWLIPGG
ncbi:hypothetical protein [Nonomuraea sp. NPDC050786]|uniref:hypothetical protein n=1 Tax=Nonomuraea sp. NPDC050786 TaxID=3154840 RepID=UPI0033C31438